MSVADYVPAVCCGIALVLFGVACAVPGVRRVRRRLELRRARRRFLQAAADPQARMLRFVSYDSASRTFIPHGDDEEAAR